MDLIRAYHQIAVAPKYVPKTAVTTPFGLIEFVQMPFGLRNSAQTFQIFYIPEKVQAVCDFPQSQHQLRKFINLVISIIVLSLIVPT